MRTSDIRQELERLGNAVNVEDVPVYIKRRLDLEGIAENPKRPRQSGAVPTVLDKKDKSPEARLQESSSAYFYFNVANAELEIRGQYVWVVEDTLLAAYLGRADEEWIVDISRIDNQSIRKMGVRYNALSIEAMQVEELADAL
jgi:hypothetical protein